MPQSDSSWTSVSLLLRVGRDLEDREAWGAFVDRYAPKVYSWCRAWKLQEADAEDVTQAVLVKLARQMQRFTYDPSKNFRGWLRTLAEHAWRDWAAERREQAGGGEGRSLLDDLAARDDLARRLEREFDLELLEEASRRVQTRVASRTWDAYRLTAVEGVAGAEAAGRLGLSVAAVYMAKSNVLALLRDEVKNLDRPGPIGPPDVEGRLP